MQEELNRLKNFIESSIEKNPAITLGAAFAIGTLMAQPRALGVIARLVLGGEMLRWQSKLSEGAMSMVKNFSGSLANTRDESSVTQH